MKKNLKYFLWLCNISIHLLYKYILVKLNAFLNVANQLILIITPECLKVLKLWEILSIQEFLHARKLIRQGLQGKWIHF